MRSIWLLTVSEVILFVAAAACVTGAFVLIAGSWQKGSAHAGRRGVGIDRNRDLPCKCNLHRHRSCAGRTRLISYRSVTQSGPWIRFGWWQVPTLPARKRLSVTLQSPLGAIIPDRVWTGSHLARRFSPNKGVGHIVMTKPVVQMPWWLTVDVSIIVIAAILIGIGFWIGVY